MVRQPEQGDLIMSTNTPEGFKRYYVLVDEVGRIHQLASCSLIEVDTFDERELKAALEGPESLDKTMTRFDAQWLAPVVRKGLGENLKPRVARTVETVGKIWRREIPTMEKVGEIIASVSIGEMISALVAMDEDPR
jgi:hypothetical protein